MLLNNLAIDAFAILKLDIYFFVFGRSLGYVNLK